MLFAGLVFPRIDCHLCVEQSPIDIGLAQPGLPGGAFGASLQGPGKEVRGGPASRRSGSSAITCVSSGLTGGTGSRFLTVNLVCSDYGYVDGLLGVLV